MRSTMVVVAGLLAASSAKSQTTATRDDSLYAAVDGWVSRGLVRYQIAGAALAIVRDGAIVHRRGFGMADIARGYPVDPDTTVFHVASVTKLVTAIAALQQVEANRLSLQRDIRGMLGNVTAPGWSEHPVTLHDLLTHTAGIETRWIGMATRRPADVRHLKDYLPEAMPGIIDAPGSVVRYSNFGFAAVGLITETASGVSWSEYVEQRILAPLGMQHSYARPREPGPSHAVPYRYRRDTTPEPSVYEHASPAGSMHSTAVDLALLVGALLDTTSSVPLSPASKRLVLAPQMQLAPGVAGYAYGTFEYPNERVKAVSAGGEVPGVSTRVLIVPSLHLGVVLMVNRKDPTLAVSVFDSLLARIAPPSDTVASCAARNTHPRRTKPSIDGAYRSNVYERHSFLRIGALIGPTLTIRSEANGALMVVDPISDQAGRWVQTGDSTWLGPAGRCLSLMMVHGAPMVALSTTFAGPLMLERISGSSTPALVLAILAAAIAALVTVVIAETWTSMRRSNRTGDAPFRRALPLTVSLVQLIYVGGFVFGLYQLAIAYDDRFAFGLPAWFTAVLLLPYLALVLTAVLAITLARRRGDVRSQWRGWLTVSASAMLLVTVWTWRTVWLP